jgi:BirA family transcriptional regulator, biotin operon repressor / biotin---[acetyl-CoA-carboxylase] ligase
MRVLTDDPTLAVPFFPAAASSNVWQRRRHLSPFDRALVDAFGGAPAWSLDLRPGDSLWSTIVVLSTTNVSQFDTLDRLIGGGTILDGPVACIALVGERFHGQRGRPWAAARGNLHVSVAVPIALDAAYAGVGLSMLPAVAALDAIAATTGGATVPAIKWVNDIVIGERKVGGVLTAAHSTGRTIDDVVWGIGINIAVAPEIVATPFVRATSCLHAERGGESVTVEHLFWALLAAIARRHGHLARSGSRELFEAYRRRSLVVGREVQVWEESACTGDDPAEWGAPLAEGVVADIADNLSLRLKGQPTPVTKGRLALRAPHVTCS